MSNLNEIDPAILAAAVQTVLDTIKPAMELVPDATFQTSCPLEVMGNYDDVWEAAQDNGEALMAQRIRDALTEKFGITL